MKEDFDYDRLGKLVSTAEALLEALLQYVGWIMDKLTGFHAKLKRVFQDLDTFFEQVINDHLSVRRMKQEQEDIIDVKLKVQSDQTNGRTKPCYQPSFFHATLYFSLLHYACESGHSYGQNRDYSNSIHMSNGKTC